MKSLYAIVGLTCCLFLTACAKKENNLEVLLSERVSSVVAVKYTIHLEEGRQAGTAYGIVIDKKGLILVPEFLSQNLPEEQIKELKIVRLNEESEGVVAQYVGADPITDLHYIRAPEDIWDTLTPVEQFGKASVSLGEEIWGIGIIKLSEKFFRPMFLRGSITLKEKVPWEVAVANSPVTHLGSAVFNSCGAFVGMGLNSLNVAYNMSTDGKEYNISIKRSNSSEIFIRAEDLFKYTYKNPEESFSTKLSWAGLVGLQPLDRDVAKLYNLEEQGAIVLSQVLEGSPAEKAGLQPFDIITHINGKKLEKFHNIWDTITNFRLVMSRMLPGDEITLRALHDDDHMDHTIVLEEMPTRQKEAKRHYFKSLGFTVREFVLSDAIDNKYFKMDFTGATTQFVRRNSLAEDAELLPGDWIKEIDGVEIKSYEDAIAKLTEVVDNPSTTEVLLLVERQGDTKVLRVKLQ